MMPDKFKDYYQILQVHYDASPDVIKAAYRKLCTLYHPDSSKNPNENSRMLEINEAYKILSNSDLRSEYHRQWMDRFTNRQKNVYSALRTDGVSGNNRAKDVLDQFFHSLLSNNWAAAYNCLTPEDQKRITMSEFVEWKEAVSSCFEMQDYHIQPYRTYNKCRIDSTIYPMVIEFAVMINDLDLQTSKTSHTTSHKYVVFDGTSWKVCLGVRSVKQATLKFKLMAQRRQNFDPVMLYKNAVSRNDALTGLLSEKGFYDDAFKEVERHRRYNNPLTLVAFQINADKPDREISCLCQCASSIKSSARLNDIIGRFGNRQIICLLVETNYSQALSAVNKFMSNIKLRQTEPYTVNAGILQYDSRLAIEDAVFAVSSDASNSNNEIKINRECL